jgi:hypothetical protein
MSIVKKQAGTMIYYYQYFGNGIDVSDKFFFASNDEESRLESLQKARDYRKLIRTNIQFSLLSLIRALRKNKDRLRGQHAITSAAELDCTLDFK